MNDSLGAALYLCANSGDLEGTKKILGEHADAVKAFINFTDEDGWTSLMKASLEGHLPVVQLLCERKANVNHSSQHGYTALMVASEQGNIRIIRCLVENGARLNDRDENGETALLWACKNDVQSALLLIELGSDVNLHDQHGLTPLMAAACNNQQDTVRRLVALGVNVNAAHADGSTALHGAAAEGHTAVVQILLLAGATTPQQATTVAGAMTVAIEGKHDEVVECLQRWLTSRSTAPPHLLASLSLATIGTASATQDHEQFRVIVDALLASQRAQKAAESALVSEHDRLAQSQTLIDSEREEKQRLQAELDQLRGDLQYTEEESSFLGKELSNSRIAVEDLQARVSQYQLQQSHQSTSSGIFQWSGNLLANS